MKNSGGRHFKTRVITNILYSTVISMLFTLFVVLNTTMIAEFLNNQGGKGYVVLMILENHIIMVLVYVLVGIVVFSISFLYLQEKAMRYIRTLCLAMENISEGDFNTVVEVEGDDEFSSMASNLNQMVEELRQLMEKEREAERTKNELITNVAHDLRTPLTSIIGYLELLSLNTQMTKEGRDKYIEIAYLKARRLEKLIEDLFGFTKLNHGKMTMNVATVDVIKLLEQLLEEFYPSFTEKELSYELKTNVSSCVIMADGDLLARLFDNLINNAIKYGADGKRVVVDVAAQNEIVAISVTNYGYTIPKEELPFIFNKFYRVEQSRSTDTGGTGLGLAIVKNIVDIHGGTIEAMSDVSGTVFRVKLQVNFDSNRENFGRIG